MGIRVNVICDESTKALSVEFRTANEKKIMGVPFPVRSEFLARTSWSDASVGRLPEEIIADMGAQEIEALQEQVLDTLIAYNIIHPPVIESEEDDDDCHVPAFPQSQQLYP